MSTINEDSVATVAAKTAVIAGGSTALWGYLADNALGVVGVLVAVITTIIGWYYKNKADERAADQRARHRVLEDLQEEERRLRIELLHRGLPIPDLPAEPTVPGPLFDAED